MKRHLISPQKVGSPKESPKRSSPPSFSKDTPLIPIPPEYSIPRTENPIATILIPHMFISATKRTLSFFSLTDTHLLKVLNLPGDFTSSFYHASERKLWVATGNGTVLIVDVRYPHLLKILETIPTSSHPITSFTLLPFSTVLLACSSSGAVIVFDLASPSSFNHILTVPTPLTTITTFPLFPHSSEDDDDSNMFPMDTNSEPVIMVGCGTETGEILIFPLSNPQQLQTLTLTSQSKVIHVFFQEDVYLSVQQSGKITLFEVDPQQEEESARLDIDEENDSVDNVKRNYLRILHTFEYQGRLNRIHYLPMQNDVDSILFSMETDTEVKIMVVNVKHTIDDVLQFKSLDTSILQWSKKPILAIAGVLNDRLYVVHSTGALVGLALTDAITPAQKKKTQVLMKTADVSQLREELLKLKAQNDANLKQIEKDHAERAKRIHDIDETLRILDRKIGDPTLHSRPPSLKVPPSQGTHGEEYGTIVELLEGLRELSKIAANIQLEMDEMLVRTESSAMGDEPQTN
ncbi:hypothetical protein BLNAU_20981 [Blattamonas nauphoetae]|uniref:Uncharacterized protein n=1 Tax=Blattamonas nauphoetae TaxID=2049346 RepID=A0ABQ9WZE2_9EUKA|nr:hypothetical protein BLNAU_20981 [Blattamonas nauphoetae]